MPSRPDIRELASNVREAFSDMEREALLDVLTFVLKEYVVEGPPPMMLHQAETLADLQGASFAQLITAMQTRFDFPELAMFVVDGEQVSVRVGGVVQPLLPGRQPLAPEPTARTPVPQPGVRVVETTLAQRPTAPAQSAAPQAPGQYIDTRPAAAAPPPIRGISLSGRPTGGGAPAPAPALMPAPSAPATPPAAPPAAAAAPQAGEKSDKPEGHGDDASARFSLLELD
jgi:hypothetical protein